MKNNVIIIVVFLVLVIKRISCLGKTNENVFLEDETKTTADTVFDPKNSYYLFLKKNYPESFKDQVMFFKEKDIDLDKQNEAIIAFGQDSKKKKSIEKIFVLKNENGIIQHIKSDFGRNGYSIEEVKLISSKDKKRTYIGLDYYNSFYKEGFDIYDIYEMMDNQINQIFFPYEVEMELYTGGNYFFLDYPSSIEDLINQYLYLKSFDSDNPSIKQRLQELCLDKTANLIPWSKKEWSFAFCNNMVNNFPLLRVYKDENGLTAKAFFRDFGEETKGKKMALKFELQKTDDKWQITKVELL